MMNHLEKYVLAVGTVFLLTTSAALAQPNILTNGDFEATTVRMRISPFDVPTGVYPNEFGLAILEEKRLFQRERADDAEASPWDVDTSDGADNAPRHG